MKAKMVSCAQMNVRLLVIIGAQVLVKHATLHMELLAWIIPNCAGTAHSGGRIISLVICIPVTVTSVVLDCKLLVRDALGTTNIVCSLGTKEFVVGHYQPPTVLISQIRYSQSTPLAVSSMLGSSRLTEQSGAQP